MARLLEEPGSWDEVRVGIPEQRGGLQTVVGTEVTGAEEDAAAARERLPQSRLGAVVELERPGPMPEEGPVDRALDEMLPRQLVELVLAGRAGDDGLHRGE